MKLCWYVYLVQCADGTLYCGIATDVERRVREHNTSHRGAKYTRTRRPVRLVYTEEHVSRSAAAKREYAIKRMSRHEKLKLAQESRR